MSGLKQHLGASNPPSISIVATALVKQYTNMAKDFFYQKTHFKGKWKFSMYQFIFISQCLIHTPSNSTYHCFKVPAVSFDQI